MRARYAERSGRDLAEIDYYVALGFWKLAIILEGVFARYAAGQYGKDEEGFQEFAKRGRRLAEAADEAERRCARRTAAEAFAVAASRAASADPAPSEAPSSSFASG